MGFSGAKLASLAFHWAQKSKFLMEQRKTLPSSPSL